MTLADLLEPGSLDAANRLNPQNESIQLSIAISLKRIADASEQLQAAFQYQPNTYNFFDVVKESK